MSHEETFNLNNGMVGWGGGANAKALTAEELKTRALEDERKEREREDEWLIETQAAFEFAMGYPLGYLDENHQIDECAESPYIRFTGIPGDEDVTKELQSALDAAMSIRAVEAPEGGLRIDGGTVSAVSDEAYKRFFATAAPASILPPVRVTDESYELLFDKTSSVTITPGIGSPWVLTDD